MKILLDAIGSAQIGRDILEILSDGGCQVAWYNPIRWYTLGRFNNRTHRKSLIVDGRIAFTGGAGIADHWRGDARNPERVARHADSARRAGRRPLADRVCPQLAADDRRAGDRRCVLPGDSACRTSGGTDAAQLARSRRVERAHDVLPVDCRAPASRFSSRIHTSFPIPWRSAPDRGVPAAAWTCASWCRASGTTTGSPDTTACACLAALLRAGIEIQEFNRTMLHHKTMVVDRRWVTIGTTNFDNRSFAHNEESNVCLLRSPIWPRSSTKSFSRMSADAVRVTLKDWQRRGLWARSQELVASFLQEQA